MASKRTDWTGISRAAKAELKVGGQVCQCGACLRFFTGVGPFDRHLGGTPEHRHCLTEKQMLGIGMEPNCNGVWMYGKPGRKADLVQAVF